MPRRILVWPVRLGVTVVLLGALWWLGRIPVGEPSQEAMLRLSWRMSGAQVRLCRDRTEEELSRLLPHMRTPQVCIEYAVPYRLTLHVDGDPWLNKNVSPGGAKGDRPIYVQEDLPIAPGKHRVRVTYAPLTPEDETDTERDEHEDEDDGDEALRKRLREEIAAQTRFVFDEEVVVEQGRITLLELQEGTHAWRVH